MTYLAQAKNLVDALNSFQTGMKWTMADYEIVSVSETAIIDAFANKLSPLK